jgi:hypothetical protein
MVGRFSPCMVKTMVITQFLLIWQNYHGEIAERGESKFG